MSQTEEAGERTVWKIQNAEFDPIAWQIRVDGEAVEAQDYPKKVLRYFVENADRVVTKDELIENTAQQRVVADGAVTNVISKLRAALGPDASQCLKTVRGRGYRLENVVRVAAQSPVRPVENDTVPAPTSPTPPSGPRTAADPIPESKRRRWFWGGLAVLLLLAAAIAIWYTIHAETSTQEQVSGLTVPSTKRATPPPATHHAVHASSATKRAPAADWLVAAASRINPGSHAEALAREYYRKGVHAYLNQRYRAAHARFKTSKALIRNRRDAADPYALAYAGDIAALSALGQSQTALALLHSFPAIDASGETSRSAARINYWLNTLYTHPSAEIAHRMRSLAKTAAKQFSPHSPEYWATKGGLAMNEARSEQWSLAYRNLTDAYDHLASFGDRTFWSAAKIAPTLARAAAHTGHCDIALPRLQESRDRLSKQETVQTPLWADTHFALARCLTQLGQYDPAKDAIDRVLTLYTALAADSSIAKKARQWRERVSSTRAPSS